MSQIQKMSLKKEVLILQIQKIYLILQNERNYLKKVILKGYNKLPLNQFILKKQLVPFQMTQREDHNQQIVQKMEIENDQDNQNQQLSHLKESENEEIQFHQITQEQYEKYCQDVEQTSKKIINKQTNNQQNIQQQIIQPVKNPVSAYMVFTMRWKKDNPQKKFNMTNLGELWKNLQSHQKRQFQEEYRRQKEKYDLYIASKLIANPNQQKEIDPDNKFFFPLHRIKSIMKQDKYFAPKTQAVTAMARATQYFGEFFLEELKKIASGKNRIDTKDLFDCISANQRTFWFLDCLIDDYAQSNRQKKPLKIVSEKLKNKEKQVLQEDFEQIDVDANEKKKLSKGHTKTNGKSLPKDQATLTSMFSANRNN